MKLFAYLLGALMFFMAPAYATDTVIELQTGDTVLGQCVGFECPPPVPCGNPDMGFPFGHGALTSGKPRTGTTIAGHAMARI